MRRWWFPLSGSSAHHKAGLGQSRLAHYVSRLLRTYNGKVTCHYNEQGQTNKVCSIYRI